MKQATIPLTKIGFFNPVRFTDAEIEQSFITRIPFFEFLFKKIIAEKANSIPQHYLVIGQRGMGKTSLLVRIAAELRKSPYKDSFIPLSFPEEQYNVDKLSKFWLNCLDALADALDKENNTTELAALDAEISTLSRESNAEANFVFEKFKAWTTKINRRPVLLVDNLNLIFSKINKEEQHQLRAILMSNAAPILVGASATTIEETIDYGAPFYDAFQISYLKKLSFQESLDVLLNLAKITGNENFEKNVQQHKGRLEALYQLTGGTPRTLAILFPLIQDGFSESIQTDLDALLDVITPLYKARFEELSPQLQVVLDAVALHWDPINLKQLREVTHLENAQLSSQLKRLIDVGWLQKLDAYKAKGGAHELTERFFNVWYLMRRSSRRQKRELYCLTKFLESFYGSDLQEIAKTRILSKCENTNHITLDLALADAVKDKKLSTMLKNRSYDKILEISVNNENILQNFSVPTEITEDKINKILVQATACFDNKEYEKCLYFLNQAVKIDSNDDSIWYNIGYINQFHLNKYSEAEIAYRMVVNINNHFSDAWVNLGNIYQDEYKNYNEAEIIFKDAIAAGNNNVSLWFNLANLYQRDLAMYEMARKSYENAIAVDSNKMEIWHNLGNLYQIHLNDYEKAKSAFLEAIRINDKEAPVWFNLGNLYLFCLKKYGDAENAYKKAIELDKAFAAPWNCLGILYSNTKDFNKAEISFKNAIEIDKNYGSPWLGLGSLYHHSLLKYIDAELAYKKGIELDKKNPLNWLGLGQLQQNVYDKYLDAEKSYKNAIDLDSEFGIAWNCLGNLYQDNLRKFEKAELAYLKAIELDSNDFCAKYNLVFLWRDKMNKVNEAKQLFETMKAIEPYMDSHYLNESLFAFYDNNLGIAQNFIEKALLEIGENLPPNTQDDWYRAAAVIIKLGYGNNLLQVLAKRGYNTILRPFYVAIESLTLKEDEFFLNSIAVEVREPAKKIVELMKSYMQ